MTPEQERTLDELIKAADEGKIAPCIVGDWAYANGVWNEARDRYNSALLSKLMGAS